MLRTPAHRVKPLLFKNFGMERAMGIEPTQLAWKARALPLSYARKYLESKWMGRTGFEPV